MLGTMLHDTVFNGKLTDKKVTTYCIVGGVFLLVYSIFVQYSEGKEALRYLVSISMFISLFCIAHILEQLKNNIVVNIVISFFTMLSVYSLQLYMFNHFIMTPTRYVLYHFLHLTDSTSRILICTTLCITLTLFTCKLIIEKSKVLSFLCGIGNKGRIITPSIVTKSTGGGC